MQPAECGGGGGGHLMGSLFCCPSFFHFLLAANDEAVAMESVPEFVFASCLTPCSYTSSFTLETESLPSLFQSILLLVPCVCVLC